MIYDAIVVGLGAMGSAAAFHLAERGSRVLGIDRYRPPHAMGSSHGFTRIIRQAYFESPIYVPLVQRAYAEWERLESLAGTRLLTRTGGLMIGHPDQSVAGGALRSAQQHKLPHEVLGAAEMRRRFPLFNMPDDYIAVLEPEAGYLAPEACIRAHLTLATQFGARLHFDEGMIAWRIVGSEVEVRTNKELYRTRRLVLAAGAWNAKLLSASISSSSPASVLPLSVERCVQHWFQPPTCARQQHGGTRNIPVFIWEYEPGRAWYGFPEREEGMKLGLHHHGEVVDADRVDRSVSISEVARMRELVRLCMPDADGPVRTSDVCLYTNTPDEYFVLGSLPDSPQVIVASPCSGHGFKFSSSIGQIVAQLVIDGGSDFDISAFRVGRFGDDHLAQLHSETTVLETS